MIRLDAPVSEVSELSAVVRPADRCESSGNLVEPDHPSGWRGPSSRRLSADRSKAARR